MSDNLDLNTVHAQIKGPIENAISDYAIRNEGIDT